LNGIAASSIVREDFLFDGTDTPPEVLVLVSPVPDSPVIVGSDDGDIIIDRFDIDVIDGGLGNDRLVGGGGANVFFFEVGDGQDGVSDFETGSDQIDLRGSGIAFADLAITDVSGDAQITYDAPTNSQITLNGVAASALSESDFLLDVAAPPLPQITGTGGNDNLAGTSAAEELLGLGGNDGLNGRGGDDRHVGGAGDDRYYIESAGDVVVEEAGEGYDRVYSSISFTLQDNVEAGATRGSNAMDITGNALDNWITANDASNALLGGAGNDRLIAYGGDDTLNGGVGRDVLEGGTGADVFVIDSGSDLDLITDFEAGIDLIDITSLGLAYSELIIVDYPDAARIVWDDPGIPGALGVIVLTGVTASELLLDSFVTAFGSMQPAITGTEGDDVLFGSQIGDEILGLGGNDRLDGAAGADTLIGGAGDDRYDVDDAGDIITELAGEGADQVYTSVSITMSENVENARALDGVDVDLTGNADVNWLTGNAGANILRGDAGNDRLQGREGADVLDGGADNDILEGGSGADRFVFVGASGTDQVLDFVVGEDVIEFQGLGANPQATLGLYQSGVDTLITYTDENSDSGVLLLRGVVAANLTLDDDIVFV
ncbi:MAG: calcium-binding protein, partial [Pseudomonadota bacterium]